MQECRDALWAADEAAGWTDNVTIGLAQVISGCPDASKPAEGNAISNSKAELIKSNKRLKWSLAVIVALILLASIGAATHKYMPTIKTWLYNPSDTTIVQDGLEILENNAIEEATQEAPQSNDSEAAATTVNKPNQETPTYGNAAKGKDVEIAIQTQDVITSDNIADSEEESTQSVVTGNNIEVQIVDSNDSIK